MILGIGNDLVDCRRIEKTLKHFDKKFMNRIGRQQEQEYIQRRKNQVAGYAKLFAMKEAVLKALGTGLTQGVSWHDIEIFRQVNGAPYVELSGFALKMLEKITPKGLKANIHISVSDEWPYAQAFAMISATISCDERKL